MVGVVVVEPPLKAGHIARDLVIAAHDMGDLVGVRAILGVVDADDLAAREGQGVVQRARFGPGLSPGHGQHAHEGRQGRGGNGLCRDRIVGLQQQQDVEPFGRVAHPRQMRDQTFGDLGLLEHRHEDADDRRAQQMRRDVGRRARRAGGDVGPQEHGREGAGLEHDVRREGEACEREGPQDDLPRKQALDDQKRRRGGQCDREDPDRPPCAARQPDRRARFRLSREASAPGPCLRVENVRPGGERGPEPAAVLRLLGQHLEKVGACRRDDDIVTIAPPRNGFCPEREVPRDHMGEPRVGRAVVQGQDRRAMYRRERLQQRVLGHAAARQQDACQRQIELARAGLRGERVGLRKVPGLDQNAR